LFTVPESGRWHNGTIGLLGDAVHAMLPFAAQGAGMAIEDAAVLAKVLGDGPAETAAQVTKALRRYRRLRRARVAKVQSLAEKQGRIYHMSGPVALARDLSIRVLGPKRVLARQRWIHDWKI
jgi:salicylate hydroxylase